MNIRYISSARTNIRCFWKCDAVLKCSRINSDIMLYGMNSYIINIFVKLESGGMTLYDFSSSYFEGCTCPHAKLGHNRDGKKGKLQVNYKSDFNFSVYLNKALGNSSSIFDTRFFCWLAMRSKWHSVRIDSLCQKDAINDEIDLQALGNTKLRLIHDRPLWKRRRHDPIILSWGRPISGLESGLFPVERQGRKSRWHRCLLQVNGRPSV